MQQAEAEGLRAAMSSAGATAGGPAAPGEGRLRHYNHLVQTQDIWHTRLYFTALMIAHFFQKAAAKEKEVVLPGGVQLILVSGPLLGPVRGTLSASPLPGCAGLI